LDGSPRKLHLLYLFVFLLAGKKLMVTFEKNLKIEKEKNVVIALIWFKAGKT